MFCIIIILKWLFLIRNKKIPSNNLPDASLAFSVTGIIIFIWITSVVAHSVHFYAGVRFDESAMIGSEIFQASISIVWTLTAFIAMCLGTRNKQRKVWFAGASILGVIFLKLFLIDLVNSSGIARIVSFTAVGILALVIGYFSPIPPKQKP